MTTNWKKFDQETLKNMALAHHIPAITAKKDIEERGVWFVTEGQGATVKDMDGHKYIDGIAGGTLAMGVGYGRKEIAQAMYDQALQMHYTAPYRGVSPITVQLEAKLAEITPGSLSSTFFADSGSEAVEAAIKLAKQYHFYAKDRSKYKVISRKHAYHGTTMGALACTGPGPAFDFLRFMSEQMLMPCVSHITAPYCYRCDLELEYPGCDIACAKELKKEIETQGPETVSAFIGEPVIGGGGCIPPVPEYWPIIRSICDEYGVLLIADEVINGFGRTGKMFACEHWGLVPDIMTMAKNITGCYFPLSATIMKSELAEIMPRFMHVHTWSGHAVGCAAALATIDIIERENLVTNAAELGAYMLDGLKTLSNHPIVGEVRGLGMIYGVELVKDKKTKERFPLRDSIADKVAVKAFDYGIFIRSAGGDIIEIAPVLTINKKEADAIVEGLDRSLTDIEREL